MCVGLENGGARAHDFAALATGVARGTDRLYTAAGRGKLGTGCTCALSCRLARAVRIKDDEAMAMTVMQAAQVLTNEAVLAQVVEEKLTEGFETGVSMSRGSG